MNHGKGKGLKAFEAPVTRGIGKNIAGFLLILGLTGLLNRAGLLFEVSRGVSLVFPAAAVVVVGALFFRWWGLAGSFLGFALTHWGLSTTLLPTLYFSFAGTLLGLVPMLALDYGHSRWPRCVRSLSWGVIINSIISGLFGMSGVLVIRGSLGSVSEILTILGSWVFSDIVAIILLALPVLVALRPELILEPHQVEIYQRWRRTPRYSAPPLLGVLAVAVLMEIFRSMNLFQVHWIAAALLLPILMASVRGGIGGALQTNAVAGLLYLFEVFRFTDPGSPIEMLTEVVSSYLNLIVFCLASVAVGLVWGKSESLLRELDEHRMQLQDNFEMVVTALAAAVEAKDPLTEGHVQRVARMAVAVGRDVGIKGPDLELLRYGALLHDVGKIGVPEEILNKSGPLSTREKIQLEKHVAIGVDILESVEILAPAVPYIRYHQERWDGRTGDDLRYPGYLGLKGEDIPLGARIIAVVDAWDAMTNDRPYRRAMSGEEAIEELQAESGRQFDPWVVESLLKVIHSGQGVESGDRIPILGARIA